MSAKLRLFFLALFLLCFLALPLNAQSLVRSVQINTVSTENFPEIELLVRATDLNGKNVPDLGISDFTILEEDQPVTNPTIEEENSRIAVHFLIDAGSTMVDSPNQPRWDRAESIITDFAVQRPVMRNGEDFVTVQVVEPNGTVVDLAIDEIDANAITAAVGSFSPKVPTNDLANVITAADAALERLNSAGEFEGISKAIVILSGDLQITQQRQALIDKAKRFQIPIYTVLLKPDASSFTPPLQELADNTNGRFTTYIDASSLNGIFNELELARLQYKLTYETTSGASGARQVEVQAGSGTDTESYSIEIGPPRILISEPGDGDLIERRAAEFTEQLDAIAPTTVDVRGEVITTPPRRLRVARLLVNGDVVDSTNTPGRELNFVWDLRRDQILGTTPYRLEIEVEDTLGLTGRSDVLNVDVNLIVPEERDDAQATLIAGQQATIDAQSVTVDELADELAQPDFPCLLTDRFLSGNSAVCAIEQTVRGNWIGLIGILVSLGAIIFVLSSRSKPAEAIRTTITDVGTRLTQQFRAIEPRGYLMVVQGDGANVGRQLPIYGTTPIGRSREHAQLLFHQNNNDSPISRLHCTIVDEESHFLIRDEGSTHGTYINGMRIPPHQSTMMLNDGDEIELALVEQGGIQLIFQLAEVEDFEEYRQTGQEFTEMIGEADRPANRGQTLIDDSLFDDDDELDRF